MPQIQGNELPDSRFLEALHQVKYPFLVAHVTPDADAIGSALGLATAMREHGIEATVGLPEDCVADRLLFMLSLAPETPLKPTWTPNEPFDAVAKTARGRG